MASRARLEGICDYRLWTTEELIEAYAFEAGRRDQRNREITQREIKKELKRRFDATLRSWTMSRRWRIRKEPSGSC